MLALLCPNLYVSSICQVDLSRLAAAGIKGIVFDIDNTVVHWGSRDVSGVVFKWLGDAKAQGFRMCVLSNNLKRRVEDVSRTLGIPAARGFKPMKYAFRSALGLLGTAPFETAVIGDQLFTDVLGGNLAGLYTILVKPMSYTEFITTRVVRRLETVVLGYLMSRGMLVLEGEMQAKDRRHAAGAY